MTQPLLIQSDSAAIALAVGMVVVPVLLGLLLARLLRPLLHRLRHPGRAFGLLALAPVLVGLALPAEVFGLGYWDWLLLALLFAFGIVLGSLPRQWLRIGRLPLAIALPIAALALELPCRLVTPGWVPPPGMTTQPLASDFWATQDPMDWQMLYPDLLPESLAALTLAHPADLTAPGPKVLHVGSTMLIQSGPGGDPQVHFPRRLNTLMPGVHHFDAGTSATGIDLHAALVGALARRLGVDLVVLHVLSRDLWMLDRHFAFCGLEPLLSYGVVPSRLRCPRPVSPLRLNARLLAPPPFPLRAALPYVRSAQILVQAWLKALPEYPFVDRHDPDAVHVRNGAHFARILGEVANSLRAQAIPLVVVVLPDQDALAGNAARQRLQHWLIARTQAVLAPAQVPVLSAVGLFQEVVARDGTAPWFVGTGYFTARGHERMASWLAAKLPDHLRKQP